MAAMECRGKEGHTKQRYPSSPAICIRDMDQECSTVVMNTSNGYSYLQTGCLRYVKVGCKV